MFETLPYTATKDEEIYERLKTSITQHLQSLKTELKLYFLERNEQEAAFAGNLFLTTLNVSDIPDELQDQFYDLQNDLSARDAFHKMALPQFWCAMCESNTQVSELAFRILLPFFTTYICECGFSALVQRNKSTKSIGFIKH